MVQAGAVPRARADDQVAVEDVARDPPSSPALQSEAERACGSAWVTLARCSNCWPASANTAPSRSASAPSPSTTSRHLDDPAAQGDHERPEPCLAPDQRPLDGEVVDLLAPPLLERQVLDAGPLADEQLGDAVVEGARPGSRASRAAGPGQRRSGSTTTRVWAKVAPATVRRCSTSGSTVTSTSGHVQERPGGDQGGVQGREPVLVVRRRRGHEAGARPARRARAGPWAGRSG